mgnify:CR=1 FL=1
MVNENDLAKYIKKGHISGAAFDVFSKEPAIDSPLFGLKEVVVTPHLGASTFEASEGVSYGICRQVRDFILEDNYPNPFNGSTIIPYTMKIPSKVTLIITDIMGREVYSTIIEHNMRGKYKFYWEGICLLYTSPSPRD